MTTLSETDGGNGSRLACASYGVTSLSSICRVAVNEMEPEGVQPQSARPQVGARAMPLTAGQLAATKCLLASPIGRLYPGGQAWLAARLCDVAQGRAAAYVCADQAADSATELCGAVILSPKGYGRMKLSTIYVRPDDRRRGIGTELMRAALLYTDRAGAHEMWITVAHHLAHEISPLLHHNGFSQTALVLDRYGPGRHEAIFTRLT